MIEFKIEPLQITKKVLKELALYISRFFELDELESIADHTTDVFIGTRNEYNQQVVNNKLFNGMVVTVTDD